MEPGRAGHVRRAEGWQEPGNQGSFTAPPGHQGCLWSSNRYVFWAPFALIGSAETCWFEKSHLVGEQSKTLPEEKRGLEQQSCAAGVHGQLVRTTNKQP